MCTYNKLLSSQCYLELVHLALWCKSYWTTIANDRVYNMSMAVFKWEYPVLDVTIYNLFTTISGWITIHTFLKFHRYIYIRPSKYLKALRNEFPKFYPQIHIIVQKVQKNLPQQKFFLSHKSLTTIYIDVNEHKRLKRRQPK